jgi:antitoxin YqcF
VFANHHDHSSLTIDIAECKSSPERGVTSFSTIGLSDYTYHTKKLKTPLGIELAGACRDRFAKKLHCMLGSCAYYVMRSGRILFPGDALEGYVEMYHKSKMKHLYFTAPYLWEKTLSSFKLPDKRVLWLSAIPIADSELAYLQEHGDGKFEKALEKAGADVFDLNRKPAF